MGIIPTPPEYGNDCVHCFAPGQSPGMFKMFFGGIKTGRLWVDTLPPPPNGYHDIIQVPGTPCQYHYRSGATYRCYWHGYQEPSPHVEFVCKVDVGTKVFEFFGLPTCRRWAPNGLDSWYWDRYYDGWSFVCTPAEMASWIELATPVTGPDPRMECFPMATGEIVLRFANIQDGTNVEIKLDTALL